MTAVAAIDPETITKQFGELVNLSADELRQWLATEQSRSVGWKGPDGRRRESVGHQSGRWLVEILGKSDGELTKADRTHMRKTVGFIRRHRAQEPANVVTSRWRYSLMNWGHDPLRS